MSELDELSRRELDRRLRRLGVRVSPSAARRERSAAAALPVASGPAVVELDARRRALAEAAFERGRLVRYQPLTEEVSR